MNRAELSKILLELVEDETGDTFPDANDGTDLRTGLRLDSLDMVSLVLKTEIRLDIQIDTSELSDVTTVGQMLDLLERKLADPAARMAA